jgi:PAS domain S-box-containing protein
MTTRSLIRELWATASVEMLFESSRIGFLIVAPDRRIIDANRTFCAMIGYTLEELLAKTIVDLTHPEDLGMTHSLFQRVQESNVIQTFEKRYVRKSGEELWCKLRSEGVLDEQGQIAYRMVMAEDITVSKNNEIFMGQMAAIVEASDDAIFRTDMEGVIGFWSKGAERLYGYSAEEALGQHVSFLMMADESQLIRETREKMLRGETVQFLDEVSRHKDGHQLQVSAQVYPLKNRQGSIVAFAAVHRDIGKLKQLEEQLRHSQRMETAGMLAGTVAHDFNNILTVMLGACEFIAADVPELAREGRNLDRIERAAERAMALTRQLLAFSRRQKIAPETVDPKILLEDLMPILQRALGEDVALETRLRSQWLIREDPTQLEQIVLNLAVNARHAMPSGGRLLIETEDLTLTGEDAPVAKGWIAFSPDAMEAGSYVCISVSDTGTGMSRQVMERIFEPFFTTKEKGEGTGLGLAVVYGMVKQVGGGIRVLSRQGEGTRFRIFLPKVDVAGA